MKKKKAQEKRQWERPTMKSIKFFETRSGTHITRSEGASYSPGS